LCYSCNTMEIELEALDQEKLRSPTLKESVYRKVEGDSSSLVKD